MNRKGEDQKEDLETIQKSILEAATKVAHTTKSDREKEVRRTPEKVKEREGAAARCTQAIKKKVLRNQAMKARADHAVKEILKRKPLTELYVNGKFMEDRKEWKKELQRHCDEVFVDLDETREVPWVVKTITKLILFLKTI